MEKYMKMAKELGVETALPISGRQILFDPRAVYKCRWGCEYGLGSETCKDRDMSMEALQKAVEAYDRGLLLHGHDARTLFKASLALERQAFLDGYYFATILGNCHYCKTCIAQQGKPCPHPEKVRPCPEGHGVNVFKTVRGLGLFIDTLKTKDQTPDRYTFLLID